MRLSPVALGAGVSLSWMLYLSAARTGNPASDMPKFIDVTAKSKVHFITRASHTSQKYLMESMGSGVAALDYDRDGWMDLFFVNGAQLQDPMPPGVLPDKHDPTFWNRLYRNNHDGSFSDVTERAGLRGSGYGLGVAAADYDNDGREDLYVTSFGGNTLYHNNGDGTFTDTTAKAGVRGAGWSTSAGFIDYDRDGNLDLAVVRYLQWDFTMNIWCGDRRTNFRAFCHPDVFRPATDLLFHNNGDGTFTDVSEASGLARVPGHGLGLAFNDADGDGWPDIAVANDAVGQQLFQNRKDGSFREEGLMAGIAFDDDGRTFSGMGIAFDDFDNDGQPDIAITDLANQKYALFKNAHGIYSYDSGLSQLAEISLRHSGWGVQWLDYDNDGWKDLFVAQSHVMDNIDQTEPGIHYREAPLLARNIHGQFTNVSVDSGSAFAEPIAARGSVAVDLNNDGLIDLVVTCNDGPAKILINGGRKGHHWMTVDTIGTKSNHDGFGARIHLVSEGGNQQWGYVAAAGSYLSSNDKRVHFGLGPDAQLRLLEIKWPSGIEQTLRGVAVDRILTLREPVPSTQNKQ